MESVPDAWLSVSATTRKPREGEVDGVQYFFVSREEFMSMVEEGLLLEWAEYSGNCYGTPVKSVRDHVHAGDQVILEIDVQGAFQIRDKMPDAFLVFIEPPSLEVLEQRLRGRGTEDEDTILRRLEAAKVELSRKKEYDIRLVNDDLDTAVGELVAYVNGKAEETRG